MNRVIRFVVLMIAVLALARTAQAGVLYYSAVLNGSTEDTPNNSPGTGTAPVGIDEIAHTLYVTFSFSHLVAPNTAAHIHSATAVPGTGLAGVATQTPTYAGFPSGATTGAYTNTFDTSLASTFNAGFLNAYGGVPAGAEAALAESRQAAGRGPEDPPYLPNAKLTPANMRTLTRG